MKKSKLQPNGSPQAHCHLIQANMDTLDSMEINKGNIYDDDLEQNCQRYGFSYYAF